MSAMSKAIRIVLWGVGVLLCAVALLLLGSGCEKLSAFHKPITKRENLLEPPPRVPHYPQPTNPPATNRPVPNI